MVTLTSKIEFHYQKMDGSPVFDTKVLIGQVGEKVEKPVHFTLPGFHILTEKHPEELIFTTCNQEFLVLYAPDFQQLYVRIVVAEGVEQEYALTAKSGQNFDTSKLGDLLFPNYRLSITYRDETGKIVKKIVDKLPEITADSTSNGNLFFDNDPQVLVIEYVETITSMTVRYVLKNTEREIAESRLLDGELGTVIVEPIPIMIEEDYIFEKIRENSARRYSNYGGELIYEYSINSDIISKAKFTLLNLADQSLSGTAYALKALLVEPTATAAEIKDLTAKLESETITPSALPKSNKKIVGAPEMTLNELLTTLTDVRDILNKIDDNYQNINNKIDDLQTLVKPTDKAIKLPINEREAPAIGDKIIAINTLQEVIDFRDKIFNESENLIN
ncbi:hypothetical protein Hs30E_17220 [Lactococcus hodotermopsidis]|uniref:Uncharacterized protein n=1 Tax=Pseudolactococcus hodotermopsidis TaxID=2709157 RepID=A0A6A0BFX1_9LACT|nr:hypothetical protein [Lactococcus hodotermopsidis]GFH43171.1 hypothetical protein Hs30E_17220 [Lactococcus hodotermopsidis]